MDTDGRAKCYLLFYYLLFQTELQTTSAGRQVPPYTVHTGVGGRSGQGGHSGPGGRGGHTRQPPTAPIRPYAHTLTLLPVRYPDVLHLGGVPEEFFALALLGSEPVASFTVGDPGRFQVAG